jgi:hypothetical protein
MHNNNEFFIAIPQWRQVAKKKGNTTQKKNALRASYQAAKICYKLKSNT